jgi:quercetin dioxygenase-like cupin family protein
MRSGDCDSRTQWERKMAVHHASAGEVVDLRPLGEALSRARTTAIVKSEAFEAARLIVHAGMEIDAHQVPGPIMLHCLEGRVILGLAETSLELSAGQWVYLNGGARHSVRGIENSSLLLTILFEK